MFIHPLNSKTKISNLTEECIQPNAVDLKIGKVFAPSIDTKMELEPLIGVNKTGHRSFYELFPDFRINNPYNSDKAAGIPNKADQALVYTILPNSFVQFETQHEVEMGEGEIGWLVARSSLIRNGLIVHSGIYDAGFKGVVGGVIHNPTSQYAFIEANARIAQFLVAQSESIKKYDGQYQNKGVIK